MAGEGKTAEESGEALQQTKAEVTTPPAPEPDYKTEAEQLKGKVAQLEKEKGLAEQRYRSYQGASRQALDEAREVGRLRRSIERIEQRLAIQAQAEGDPEKLATESQKLEARLQQEEATSSLQEELAEDWAEIGKTIAEAKGLPCETEADAVHIAEVMQADPKLRGIYDLVKQAYGGKPRLIREAFRQSQELWRESYVERHTATQEAAKEKAKKETQTASLNLEAGKGTGGAGMSDTEFFKRCGEEPGKFNSPADYARLNKILANMGVM